MSKKKKINDRSVSDNKILNIIQDNHAWVIAIITGIGIIILNMFKFIEYIKCNIYFSYYGLEVTLYNYDDKNIFYDLCLSFIFVFALISLMYCFYQIVLNIKTREFKNKNNLINLSIIFSSNFYLIMSLGVQWKIWTIIFHLILLIIIEIIMTFIIFKPDNDEEISKEEILNMIKLLPFIVLLLIILIGVTTYLSVDNKKSYRIIDNSKVIAYSNKDYYLVLDCYIEDNNLVIYKGKQQKIDNNGVYSILIEFDDVEIKQDDSNDDKE